jgi:hypothetical protein
LRAFKITYGEDAYADDVDDCPCVVPPVPGIAELLCPINDDDDVTEVAEYPVGVITFRSCERTAVQVPDDCVRPTKRTREGKKRRVKRVCLVFFFFWNPKKQKKKKKKKKRMSEKRQTLRVLTSDFREEVAGCGLGVISEGLGEEGMSLEGVDGCPC